MLHYCTLLGATLQAGAGSGAEMVTAASSSACSTSSAASSELMRCAAVQGRPGKSSPAQALMPSCTPQQRLHPLKKLRPPFHYTWLSLKPHGASAPCKMLMLACRP